MKPIRIGTRGSKLALWQAETVSRLLGEAGCDNEIVRIKTTGDRRTDVSLATIGGKGLFIKEIEEALGRGDVDIAVHSLKDVPSIIPDEFELVAFLPRADARDAWVHPAGVAFSDMPAGSRIGTGSPRRRTQIRRLRPDLEVLEIRGNVDTRLSKVRAGEYDGLLLATAGLVRLGLDDAITGHFALSEITPAAGQGIVGIEILASRDDLRETLARINDSDAEVAARVERGVLGRFGTLLACYTPIAVHAELTLTAIHCHGFVSSLDGDEAIRVFHEAGRRQVDTIVDLVYRSMVSEGAMEIIRGSASEP
jgi:hydroxymethylbilane synthase